MSAPAQNILNVCANVRQSFSLLESFAEKHNISITGTIYFALIGAINIQQDETGFVQFRQMKPLQIAKLINVDSKKVARWCSTLADQGLLSRKRGSYAVENVAEWYLIANALQYSSVDTQTGVQAATAPNVADLRRFIPDTPPSRDAVIDPQLQA
jgi:hypothetical protein